MTFDAATNPMRHLRLTGSADRLARPDFVFESEVDGLHEMIARCVPAGGYSGELDGRPVIVMVDSGGTTIIPPPVSPTGADEVTLWAARH